MMYLHTTPSEFSMAYVFHYYNQTKRKFISFTETREFCIGIDEYDSFEEWWETYQDDIKWDDEEIVVMKLKCS